MHYPDYINNLLTGLPTFSLNPLQRIIHAAIIDLSKT